LDLFSIAKFDQIIPLHNIGTALDFSIGALKKIRLSFYWVAHLTAFAPINKAGKRK